MNYAEALSNAVGRMRDADLVITDDDRHEYLALSEGWLKVAAEIRQSATLTSEQADRRVDRPPVRE